MKKCASCGTEYEDFMQKCPVCGATMIKSIDSARENAQQKYDETKKEMENRRNNQKMIVRIGLLVVAIVIVVVIVGIVKVATNPQRAIDREAKKQYQTAEQYLEDGDYEQALDALSAINENWSDYQLVLDSMEEAQTKLDEQNAAKLKAELEDEIAGYQASGDYESILTLLNDNIDTVKSDEELTGILTDSAEKYKEQVISQVNTYVASGDYASADSLLTTALRVLGDDEELSVVKTEVQKKQILVKATEYQQSGAYDEAITYINDNLDVIDNDTDILSILSTCEQTYRDQVLQEAAQAYESSGYSAAVQVVSKGLSVMEDDETLKQAKTDYQNKKPVSLMDMEPFTTDEHGGFDYASGRKDISGNEYSETAQGGFYWHTSSETYDIGGAYKTFKATLAINERSKGESGSISCQIYGDDVLLWESGKLASDTKAFEVSVDVTGVTDLKIETTHYASGWDNNYVYLLLADMRVEK